MTRSQNRHFHFNHKQKNGKKCSEDYMVMISVLCMRKSDVRTLARKYSNMLKKILLLSRQQTDTPVEAQQHSYACSLPFTAQLTEFYWIVREQSYFIKLLKKIFYAAEYNVGIWHLNQLLKLTQHNQMILDRFNILGV